MSQPADIEVNISSSSGSPKQTPSIASEPRPSSVQRSVSENKSVKSAKVEEVVEVQRKALVQRWIDRGTILPNLQNPKSYTKRQKALIVFTISVASFTPTFTSNILMPAFPQIEEDFGTTESTVTLTTTVFLIANGITPLWHAYLSERFGRRPIYVFSFLLYIVASVLCATAPEARYLIGYRFIQAAGSSCAQSVGIGTITDIYLPSERGRATGWWFLGPIAGPLIAPLVAGGLFPWVGFRGILWFLVILGGVLWIFVIFFLPETSNALKVRQALSRLPPPTPSSAEAQPRGSTSVRAWNFLAGDVFPFIVQPLKSLGFIAFPPVGLTILLASVYFASLYAISTTIPWAFGRTAGYYHYSPTIVALLYIPSCIGYILGSISGGHLSDFVVKRAKKVYGDNYPPEVRLLSAWAGVPITPVGLLIFGWGIRAHLFWLVPTIGSFLFGLGMMLTTGTMMAFFADSVPGRSASVVASYNVVRNVAAGLVSVLTPGALRNIHAGFFMTIMASLCALFSINLEIVRRLGPYWRSRRSVREAEDRAKNEAIQMGTRSNNGRA